ncbi:MAG: hypothetical protein AAGD09_01360 [Cyanobacteria bacterium P01_F01_bin.56]
MAGHQAAVARDFAPTERRRKSRKGWPLGLKPKQNGNWVGPVARLAKVSTNWKTVPSARPLSHGVRNRQRLARAQLLDDRRALAEPQTPVAPSVTSPRRSTRLSARQLLAQTGYQEAELPTEEVLWQRLNQLGYRLQRVAQTQPQKGIAESEAILPQSIEAIRGPLRMSRPCDSRGMRKRWSTSATTTVGEKSGANVGG